MLDCAQTDFGGGLIKFEDLQSGCGSATLTLGLRYEELVNRGYWTARNIVEISAGDDVLTAASASGATSLAIKNPQLFDPAEGEDAQQIYLFDGTTLAMRIPVTGVSGTTLTIGSPKDVSGNTYSLPAFAQGTVVGRRRYAGYVMRRETPNDKGPRATVTLAGIGRRLNEAIGTFTYNMQDVGTAVALAINGFANRYPELLAGSYPVVNVLYSGSKERVSVSKMVSEALSAITTGDQWILRIGHDRTPRLIKLYDSMSNTYAYNQVFAQGTTYFEPVGFKQSGEDASRLFNSVEVIGDTNAATKQPARAIVQDTTSIALYGQIDAAPVTNTACKTDAACATYARAILLQQSLATADNTFRVYTHNDPYTNATVVAGATAAQAATITTESGSPITTESGQPLLVEIFPSVTSTVAQTQGDVVRAVSNVIVQRFDAIGSVVNSVPDSEIRYGAGVGALWGLGVGTTVLTGGGPSGSNAFTASTGSAFIASPLIDVLPGQVWSFDAYMDSSAITAGAIQWQISNVQTQAVFASVSLAALVGVARVAGTFTIPSGCSSIRVIASMNGATGTGKWAQPNVNLGSLLKPYTPNFAAPDVYGIATSVVSTYDPRGDTYQDVRFQAVQPDANAALSERANAVATALVANIATRIAIDSYAVSSGAFGYTSTGLVVTTPIFYAIFALGSAAIQIPVVTFTLAPSATNWVWLNPDFSITVKQDPSTVVGAILYGIFQTSATVPVGFTAKAPIGVVDPRSTTFQNILGSNFFGLQIDATGNLVMATTRDIYPAQVTQSIPVPTGLTPGSYYGPTLRFKMRFRLSLPRTSPGLVIFSDATASGTTFANGYIFEWAANVLTLYKRVNNSDIVLASASAAFRNSGYFSPQHDAVPTTDVQWHELALSMTVNPFFGTTVGAPEYLFSGALDGVYYFNTVDGLTPAHGQTGGVPAYNSGRCGPSNRGFASSTFIDPKVFSIESGAGVFAEQNVQSAASLAPTLAELQGQANPFGSVMRRGAVNRFATEPSGAAGGANLIFNPTFALGTQGWARFGSGAATAGVDGYGGGRLSLQNASMAASTYDGFQQNVAVLANQAMVLSCIIESASSAAPATVQFVVDISGFPTAIVDGTQANGRYSLAFPFNTGANTSITARVYVQNNSGFGASVFAYFYKLQLEYGTQPTPWADYRAGALTSQTHDITANLVGVGSSRFVTGSTPASNASGATAIGSNIVILSVNFTVPPGTWFISVAWIVSANTPKTELTTLVSKVRPTTGVVSTPVYGDMQTVASTGNYTTGASWTSVGQPLTVAFEYDYQNLSSPGGSMGFSPGVYQISLFRLS